MTHLYQGDCLWIMHEIPDASVDMILCDLPYGTTQNKWDSVIPFEHLWAHYKRICKGAIVLTAAQPFTSALVMSNVECFKYSWVWGKNKPSGHLNAKKQPLRNHEDIAVFYDKQPTYNPQMSSGHKRIIVPSSAKASSNYGAQVSTSYDSTERYPLSIINVNVIDNSSPDRLHPTQKPVALMEYLIRTYTSPGDTVLDNCMGSGTTGVACANTGRKFIGIEQSWEYFKIACDRIELAQAIKWAERLQA